MQNLQGVSLRLQAELRESRVTNFAAPRWPQQSYLWYRAPLGICITFLQEANTQGSNGEAPSACGEGAGVVVAGWEACGLVVLEEGGGDCSANGAEAQADDDDDDDDEEAQAADVVVVALAMACVSCVTCS